MHSPADSLLLECITVSQDRCIEWEGWIPGLALLAHNLAWSDLTPAATKPICR